MRDSGVPDDKIGCARAYSVKALWADGVDKGIPIKELIAPDGMIVALIAQMRD